MCIPAQAKEQEYEHYDMVIEISFESIRERLTAGLESRLQDVDGDPSKQFAPRNLARDVLNGDHDRLEHLFIAAQHLARIPNLVNPIAHCSATSFVALLSRNDHRSVHRIFATLLCMHMSRGLFRRFLLIFLPENETAEDTICDTHLPIDLTTAIRLFEEDGRQFYHKQFVWSPIILLEHQRVEYIDNRRFCPLPRLSKKPIGSGSFGDVSKVELAEGSIEFGTGISFQRCFAQKEFVVAQNSRHAFEDEWHVVREILRANKRHRNIMSPIAGLLHGEEADMKFSIFFPVATCNLREYLKAESPRLSANPYPLGGFNMVWIIYTTGLMRKTTTLSHVGTSTLKAQNVLVTLSETDNGTSVLFQISDFGISRVKRIRRAREVELQRSYSASNLFQRRLSASLTEGRAGDASECLAPEAYGDGSRVRETSDIWSLGCILSMVFTFLEGGPNAVRSFEEDRKRAPDYNGSWFFKMTTRQQATAAVYHDVGRGLLFERKDTIDSWFNHLVGKARQRDGEAHSLRLFLNILLSDMLIVDPARRAGAHAIYRSFKDVWQDFGNAQIEATQVGARQPRYPPHSLQPIIETGTPGFDDDFANAPRRDAAFRNDPCQIAGSAQQTETINWESRRRDHLDIPGTSYRVSPTTGSMPGQQAEPVNNIDLLCTSLCDAARVGSVHMVRMRLDSLPPETVVKNQEGRTLLSLAAENGATAVIRVLLRAGRLQTDGFDDSGRCALSWAAENGHLEAVDLLVRVGKVDVDYKSDENHGWSSLCFAAMNGHARVVEYILQSKTVEIDGVDVYGRTPLSWACDQGFADVVKVLLNTNLVRTTRKDRLGKSPWSRAVDNGHDDVVNLLVSYERARRSLWRKLLKKVRIRKRPWSR